MINASRVCGTSPTGETDKTMDKIMATIMFHAPHTHTISHKSKHADKNCNNSDNDNVWCLSQKFWMMMMSKRMWKGSLCFPKSKQEKKSVSQLDKFLFYLGKIHLYSCEVFLWRLLCDGIFFQCYVHMYVCFSVSVTSKYKWTGKRIFLPPSFSSASSSSFVIILSCNDI